MDSYRIQKRYLRPDGSIIWVEFSLSCARDEDGSVAYFLGQVLDVTAQRAQTEALRLSEQRFRQAMMNANVGVVVVDTSGRYQTVNQAFCDMVGCSEDEILGLSSASFTLPEEEEAQVQAVKKILAGEDESFRLFKRLRRVDGSLITTDISGTPIRDAEGRITSFVAHVVDITEQVEQARALQSSERRFRLLVERNSQVAFESDNNGVMTWISASVHQVIGYRPEEMVGRAFVDFVHPSDQSNLRGFQQGLIRGTGSEGELRVRTADGGWVKVAFSVGPLLDNDGVVEGRAGVWRDVSSIESPH
jgi:PAS domain S-box-containing protein